MDIRQGVVEHILLQAKLKDKASQNKQAHSAATGAPVYWWSQQTIENRRLNKLWTHFTQSFR